MTKFVKTTQQPQRISNYAAFLLQNLNAQTHPNQAFRDWVEDPGKETGVYVQELLDAGLVKEINGVISPTSSGVHYFQQKSSNTDVADLIRQIKQVLPNNPKFSVIVRSLSDTALMGLIYECLGEIGYRGNPDVPEKMEYWQFKIAALQQVLTDATPDTLWEHQQKQMESFGSISKPKKPVKK